MKKVFKKFVTMGIAAVMAVSAMSVSAFAEDKETEIFNKDTVTIFTYNEDTETYDVSYKTAPSITANFNRNIDSTRAAGFDFDQTINATFKYLRNINNSNSTTNKYFTMGEYDTTFVINLEEYPTDKQYFFKIYDVTNGNQDTTPGNYASYKLITPTCVFENNPSGHTMSVQLRTNVNSADIVGELYSY